MGDEELATKDESFLVGSKPDFEVAMDLCSQSWLCARVAGLNKTEAKELKRRSCRTDSHRLDASTWSLQVNALTHSLTSLHHGRRGSACSKVHPKGLFRIWT